MEDWAIASSKVGKDAEDRSWARAFAEQARSDLTVLKILQSNGVRLCHRIQHLQMALEKTCKAALCLSHGHETARKRTHAVQKKIFKPLVRQFSRQASSKGKEADAKALSNLASGIEKLTPAVAKKHSDENCEYPWAGPDNAPRVPALSLFGNIDETVFTKLISLLERSVESYKQS